MSSRSSLLLVVASASTLVHGHVSMKYVAGQVGPIRNANSATGNGRASVNGACGGANTFGSNGKGVIQDGMTVSFNINYAAGHRSAQNAFRMAYACGDGSPGTVQARSAMLTAGANGCTAIRAGAPAAYGDNGVAAPDAIVDGGYTIECTLPTQSVTASTECTVSLLDQRNWGGCIDLDVLPAALALPPAPPPMPFMSSSGVYSLTEAGKVDTSGPTFTCCALSSGTVSIPAYVMGASMVLANFAGVTATGCRTSDLETAPTTASHTISQTLAMVLESGNKYVGRFAVGGPMAGQPFDFTVEQGRLTFENTGAAQPIICDGVAALAGAPGDVIVDTKVDVTFAITVSLQVSMTMAQVIENMATKLSVPQSDIDAEINGAVITTIVTTPDRAAADGVLALLNPHVGNPQSATVFFGITVTDMTTPVSAALTPGGGSNQVASDGGGIGGWGVIAILLLVGIVLAGGYVYVQRQRPPPPPVAFTGIKEMAAMPPPPGPPPPATSTLPAGWQALQDPASGATYFYNAGTGESTWTRPTR